MSDETPDMDTAVTKFFHDTRNVRDDVKIMAAAAPDSLDGFLKDALLSSEQILENEGWGTESQYTMTLGSLALGEVGFGFTGVPLPPVQGELHDWFPAWINTATNLLSRHWDDETLPPMLEHIYNDHTGPSLWGAMVSAEAWLAKNPDDDASDEEKALFQQWVDGDLPVSDYPHRKELRVLLAVDLRQNMYIVERIRGEQPAYKQFTREEAFANGVDQGVVPLVARTFLMLLIMMNNRRGYSPTKEIMQVWFPHLVGEDDSE